jgi:AbrB family looped-hinge helix DNA binding protein
MTELLKRKHIFGTMKIGERGQIVIPKEARELFDIKPGDLLMVIGEEGRGITFVKADFLKQKALEILNHMEPLEIEAEDEEPLKS